MILIVSFLSYYHNCPKVPDTFFPGLTQGLRSSSVLYTGSKDWTRMSNPVAIEPGWLVGTFASHINTFSKTDATS